jgi:MFS family permease
VRRFAAALYANAIALWVGGLWAIGYLAVPALFAELDDRMLAGRLAGIMFTAMAWVGLACGGYLLAFLAARHGRPALRSLPFWLVVAMLLLTVAGHFGIQPVIAEIKLAAWPRDVLEGALKQRFAFWHGVASVVYLIESLLGLVLVAVQERGRG